MRVGKSSCARPCLSRSNNSGLITNERKMPFTTNIPASTAWYSGMPVNGCPQYVSAPPKTARAMPSQISGFVILCVRIVASFQYGDVRPKKPWRSITVTAPSPTTKPAIKRRSAIASNMYTRIAQPPCTAHGGRKIWRSAAPVLPYCSETGRSTHLRQRSIKARSSASITPNQSKMSSSRRAEATVSWKFPRSSRSLPKHRPFGKENQQYAHSAYLSKLNDFFRGSPPPELNTVNISKLLKQGTTPTHTKS